MNEFKYRIATQNDLEMIWNKNIADNPTDERWVRWKQKFIEYNADGKAVTFVVLCNEIPVGEGTLILSTECDAVKGKDALANGRDIANINALRISKEFEGHGHISALVKLMEGYASDHGISVLTIGVEAKETRNLAIYLHWGFSRFVMQENANGELVLYYEKEIIAPCSAVTH